MKILPFLLAVFIAIVSCEEGLFNPTGVTCPSQPEIFAPEGYQVETIGSIEFVNFVGSLKDIEFVSEQVGFAMAANQIGGYVEVLKTVDGGKSWRDVEIGIKQNPWRVLFLNEQVGFISVNNSTACASPNCEPQSVLLKTEDGGETWSEIVYPELKGVFYDLKADDEGILYASLVKREALGLRPFLMRSRNEGVSWDTVFSSSGFVFGGIFNFEVSEEHIFLNGRAGKIGVTDKEGNLEKVITTSSNGVIDFYVFDEQHIITTSGGAMVKSSDFGDTWEVIQEDVSRLIGFETKDKVIAFFSKSTCDKSAFKSMRVIASTQDGGLSWVEGEQATSNLGVGLFVVNKIGPGSYMILFGDRLIKLTEN